MEKREKMLCYIQQQQQIWKAECQHSLKGAIPVFKYQKIKLLKKQKNKTKIQIARQIISV